jgi:hypothetical protein
MLLMLMLVCPTVLCVLADFLKKHSSQSRKQSVCLEPIAFLQVLQYRTHLDFFSNLAVSSRFGRKPGTNGAVATDGKLHEQDLSLAAATAVTVAANKFSPYLIRGDTIYLIKYTLRRRTTLSWSDTSPNPSPFLVLAARLLISIPLISPDSPDSHHVFLGWTFVAQQSVHEPNVSRGYSKSIG